MPSQNPMVRFRVTPDEMARIEDRKPSDQSVNEYAKGRVLSEHPDPTAGAELRAAGSTPLEVVDNLLAGFDPEGTNDELRAFLKGWLDELRERGLLKGDSSEGAL